MSIIKTMRRQKAVYWPFSSTNEFGKKVFASPIQIKCRWDGKTEEFLNAEGERQLSKAVVYVDRDTPVGGVLMKGVLADITDSVNIKENDGAWEIMRFDDIPNLKASEFLKIAFL